MKNRQAIGTSQLENRKVLALEKIGRCLSAIEDALLSVIDSNKKSLRMEDIERAKVYSKHLGEKLSGDRQRESQV